MECETKPHDYIVFDTAIEVKVYVIKEFYW